jgi:hypothetical protein
VLDTDLSGRIGRVLSFKDIRSGQHSNRSNGNLRETLAKEMGSTPFGNAGPIPIGTALPQHIEIDRAGNCRVRAGVAPS